MQPNSPLVHLISDWLSLCGRCPAYSREQTIMLRWTWILFAAVSCNTPPPQTAAAPTSERPWRPVASASMARSESFLVDDEPLAADLGLSPGEVTDSIITTLLTHRLTLPAHVTVGILHLPGTRARRSWLLTTEANELTQALADSAVASLSRATRVGRAGVLPALLVGDQPTVASLREGAARLQADLLLVYRPSCRLFERQPFVGSAQYRSDCTIEAVVLDTRSGVIPFSGVITRTAVTQHQRGDFDDAGTWRRVQLDAMLQAVVEVSQRVGSFLNGVPEQ